MSILIILFDYKICAQKMLIKATFLKILDGIEMGEREKYQLNDSITLRSVFAVNTRSVNFIAHPHVTPLMIIRSTNFDYLMSHKKCIDRLLC